MNEAVDALLEYVIYLFVKELEQDMEEYSRYGGEGYPGPDTPPDEDDGEDPPDEGPICDVV